MPLAQNTAFLGNGYYRTLIGNPMLEVKPSDQQPPEVAETDWHHFRSILQLTATNLHH